MYLSGIQETFGLSFVHLSFSWHKLEYPMGNIISM